MNFNNIEFYEKNEGFNLSNSTSLNQSIQSSLSPAELKLAEESVYLRHPTEWVLSLRDLPQSYLDLLCASDGGGIINGEREVGYFGSSELREYLLSYQFPDYMQGCLPFGLNGGGVFYIFDMREPAVEGEYPILASHSGVLDFQDSVSVASSLKQLLEESEDVENLLY